MTQEEKARAYDEALERAKNFIENGDEGEKTVSESIFAGLRESEDERIRKELINFILYKAKGVPEEKEHSWVAYLYKQKINTEGDFGRGYDCGYEACLNSHGAEWFEKQKERGPLTKDEEYILHRIIEHLEDETCPSDWISLLHDIYCLPYEKQKEQKPTNSENPKELSEEQLLKEAAEGRISACGFHNAIFFKDQKWTEMLDKYEEGDKVRVIVLPKEDQK